MKTSPNQHSKNGLRIATDVVVIFTTFFVAACGPMHASSEKMTDLAEQRSLLPDMPDESLVTTDPTPAEGSVYSVYRLNDAKINVNLHDKIISAQISLQSSAGTELVEMAGRIRADGTATLMDLKPIDDDHHRLSAESLTREGSADQCTKKDAQGKCHITIVNVYYRVGNDRMRRQFVSSSMVQPSGRLAGAGAATVAPTAAPADGAQDDDLDHSGLNPNDPNDEMVGANQFSGFVGPTPNEVMMGRLNRWPEAPVTRPQVAPVPPATTPVVSPAPVSVPPVTVAPSNPGSFPAPRPGDKLGGHSSGKAVDSDDVTQPTVVLAPSQPVAPAPLQQVAPTVAPAPAVSVPPSAPATRRVTRPNQGAGPGKSARPLRPTPPAPVPSLTAPVTPTTPLEQSPQSAPPAVAPAPVKVEPVIPKPTLPTPPIQVPPPPRGAPVPPQVQPLPEPPVPPREGPPPVPSSETPQANEKLPLPPVQVPPPKEKTATAPPPRVVIPEAPSRDAIDEKIAHAEKQHAPFLELVKGGEARGGYVGGQLINGTQLAVEGSGFRQVYPKLETHYGTGMMISFLTNAIAFFVREISPATTVMIGNIARMHGGPIGNGPAGSESHQNGLDADIPYIGTTVNTPQFEHVVDAANHLKDNFDFQKNWAFFRLIESQQIVMDGKPVTVLNRIFVDGVIKSALCKWAKETNIINDPKDADILRRIRPTAGHRNHFHVRLKCSPHYPLCQQQVEPAPGPGC